MLINIYHKSPVGLDTFASRFCEKIRAKLIFLG